MERRHTADLWKGTAHGSLAPHLQPHGLEQRTLGAGRSRIRIHRSREHLHEPFTRHRHLRRPRRAAVSTTCAGRPGEPGGGDLKKRVARASRSSIPRASRARRDAERRHARHGQAAGKPSRRGRESIPQSMTSFQRAMDGCREGAASPSRRPTAQQGGRSFIKIKHPHVRSRVERLASTPAFFVAASRAILPGMSAKNATGAEPRRRAPSRELRARSRRLPPGARPRSGHEAREDIDSPRKKALLAAAARRPSVGSDSTGDGPPRGPDHAPRGDEASKRRLAPPFRFADARAHASRRRGRFRTPSRGRGTTYPGGFQRPRRCRDRLRPRRAPGRVALSRRCSAVRSPSTTRCAGADGLLGAPGELRRRARGTSAPRPARGRTST